MFVLETNRLTLRQITKADSAFVLKLLNDPSFINNIGDRGVRTVAQADDYIRDRLSASYEKFGYGLYLVASKQTDTPLGLCGLVKRDFLETADIGFAFFPEFMGKGFAHEAALAVFNYARDVLKLDRLLAITSADNKSSLKLIEKLGLQYEKTLQLADQAKPTELYSFDFDFCYEGQLVIFSRNYHLKRGYCCENTCRNCPY